MSKRAWADVSAELEQVVAAATEPFDAATVANGRELLAFAVSHCAPLEGIEKGYWSTFRFLWNEVEVEVFDDHLETYRGEEIAHFARAPGEPFPPEFLERLPKASP